MSELNSAFSIYSREDLLKSPRKISESLRQKGLVYITGYEDKFARVFEEYNTLGLDPDGSVKVLSPTDARKNQPNIFATLFAAEFRTIKRHLLGLLFRDEIEIFCQRTGPSESPPSGRLHFDKRYTFKSWYYLNDVGPSEGAMRVVPLDICAEYSPVKLREKLGSRCLFEGARTQHMASEEALKTLDPAAESITGPKGTLFLHITEAWHGASPIKPGSERKIIRAHSRPFSDYFLR